MTLKNAAANSTDPIPDRPTRICASPTAATGTANVIKLPDNLFPRFNIIVRTAIPIVTSANVVKMGPPHICVQKPALTAGVINAL